MSMPTRSYSAALAIAVLASLLGSSAIAQEELPGIKIGDKAPDFSLKDHNSKSVSLSKLLQEHNVAVVFHRSANW